MGTSFDSAVPILNGPYMYIRDMKISNDATTPNSILDVGAGICRDQTNTYDINLGNYNGEGTGTVNATTKINSAVNGLNGLDTGAIAASKVYYVYVIGDAVSSNTTGCMISLTAPSVTSAGLFSGPVMPFGYNTFRLIGYVTTDSSKNFLLGYWSGIDNARIFTYDAPQTVLTVTSSSPATYTECKLTAAVPLVANIPVTLQTNFNANAAADTLKFQGYLSTGDAVTIIAQVAGSTAHLESYNQVLGQLHSTDVSINYKTSASTDQYTVSVAAYTYWV